MEPGAVDEAGLESLQLLAGDDVVVNVDDHVESFLANLSFTYQTTGRRCQASRAESLDSFVPASAKL